MASELTGAITLHYADDHEHVMISPVSQALSPAATIMDLRKTQRSIKRLASEMRNAEANQRGLHLELERAAGECQTFNERLAAIRSKNFVKADSKSRRLHFKALSIVLKTWKSNAGMQNVASGILRRAMNRVASQTNVKRQLETIVNWKFTASRLARKTLPRNGLNIRWLYRSWHAWALSWRLWVLQIKVKKSSLNRWMSEWIHNYLYRAQIRQASSIFLQKSRSRVLLSASATWLSYVTKCRVQTQRFFSADLKIKYRALKNTWDIWSEAVGYHRWIQQSYAVRKLKDQRKKYVLQSLYSFTGNLQIQKKLKFKIKKLGEQIMRIMFVIWKQRTGDEKRFLHLQNLLSHKKCFQHTRASLELWRDTAKNSRRDALVCQHKRDSVQGNITRRSFDFWLVAIRTKMHLVRKVKTSLISFSRSRKNGAFGVWKQLLAARKKNKVNHRRRKVLFATRTLQQRFAIWNRFLLKQQSWKRIINRAKVSSERNLLYFILEVLHLKVLKSKKVGRALEKASLAEKHEGLQQGWMAFRSSACLNRRKRLLSAKKRSKTTKEFFSCWDFFVSRRVVRSNLCARRLCHAKIVVLATFFETFAIHALEQRKQRQTITLYENAWYAWTISSLEKRAQKLSMRIQTRSRLNFTLDAFEKIVVNINVHRASQVRKQRSRDRYRRSLLFKKLSIWVFQAKIKIQIKTIVGKLHINWHFRRQKKWLRIWARNISLQVRQMHQLKCCLKHVEISELAHSLWRWHITSCRLKQFSMTSKRVRSRFSKKVLNRSFALWHEVTHEFNQLHRFYKSYMKQNHMFLLRNVMVCWRGKAQQIHNLDFVRSEAVRCLISRLDKKIYIEWVHRVRKNKKLRLLCKNRACRLAFIELKAKIKKWALWLNQNILFSKYILRFHGKHQKKFLRTILSLWANVASINSRLDLLCRNINQSTHHQMKSSSWLWWCARTKKNRFLKVSREQLSWRVLKLSWVHLRNNVERWMQVNEKLELKLKKQNDRRKSRMLNTWVSFASKTKMMKLGIVGILRRLGIRCIYIRFKIWLCYAIRCKRCRCHEDRVTGKCHFNILCLAFNHWKRRSGEKKRFSHTLTRIFTLQSHRALRKACTCWELVISRTVVLNRKGNKISCSTREKMSYKVFLEFRKMCLHQKGMSSGCMKILTCLARTAQHRAWLQWVTFIKRVDSLNQAYDRVRDCTRRRLLSWSRDRWAFICKIQGRYGAVIDKTSLRSNRKCLLIGLELWRHHVRQIARIRTCMDRVCSKKVALSTRLVLDAWRAWCTKQACKCKTMSKISSRHSAASVCTILNSWRREIRRQRRVQLVLLRALKSNARSQTLQFYIEWQVRTERQRRIYKFSAERLLMSMLRLKQAAFVQWIRNHNIICAFLSRVFCLQKRTKTRVTTHCWRILASFPQQNRRIVSIMQNIVHSRKQRSLFRHLDSWHLVTKSLKFMVRSAAKFLCQKGKSLLSCYFSFWQHRYAEQRAYRRFAERVKSRRNLNRLLIFFAHWSVLKVSGVCKNRQIANMTRARGFRTRKVAFQIFQLYSQENQRKQRILFQFLRHMMGLSLHQSFVVWRKTSKSLLLLRRRLSRIWIRDKMDVIGAAIKTWMIWCKAGRRRRCLLLNAVASRRYSQLKRCLSTFADFLLNVCKNASLLDQMIRKCNKSVSKFSFLVWKDFSDVLKSIIIHIDLRFRIKILSKYIELWKYFSNRRKLNSKSFSKLLLHTFKTILKKCWYAWKILAKSVLKQGKKLSSLLPRRNRVFKSKTLRVWKLYQMRKYQVTAVTHRISLSSKRKCLLIGLELWRHHVRQIARIRTCMDRVCSKKVALSTRLVLDAWRAWCTKQACKCKTMSKISSRHSAASVCTILNSWRREIRRQRRVQLVLLRALKSNARSQTLQFYIEWQARIKRERRLRTLSLRYLSDQNSRVQRAAWLTWCDEMQRKWIELRCTGRIVTKITISSVSNAWCRWRDFIQGKRNNAIIIRNFAQRRKMLVIRKHLDSWHCRADTSSKWRRRAAGFLIRNEAQFFSRFWNHWRFICSKQIPPRVTAEKVAMCRLTSRQRLALSLWIFFSASTINFRLATSKFLRLMAQQKMRACCLAWRADSQRLRRNRKFVSRLTWRQSNVVLSQAFDMWHKSSMFMVRVRWGSMKTMLRCREIVMKHTWRCMSTYSCVRRRRKRKIISVLRVQRVLCLVLNFEAWQGRVKTAHFAQRLAAAAVRRAREHLLMRTWASWHVAANEQHGQRWRRKAAEGRVAAGLLLAAWDGAKLLVSWDSLKAHANCMKGRRLAVERRQVRRNSRVLLLSFRRIVANAVQGTRLVHLMLRRHRRRLAFVSRLWRKAVKCTRISMWRANATRERKILRKASVVWKGWLHASALQRLHQTIKKLAIRRICRSRLLRSFTSWRDLWRLKGAQRRAEEAMIQRKLFSLRASSWRMWVYNTLRRRAEKALELQREELARVGALCQRFAFVSHETIALCDGATASSGVAAADPDGPGEWT